MHFKRGTYLLLLFLSFALQPLFSQYYTPIGGSNLNRYTSVDTIYTWDENSVDSLIVGDVNGFNAGDTVMVYCPKGSEIDLNPGEDAGTMPQSNVHNQGRYAFFIIDSIDVSRKLIILNNKMTRFKPMVEGEVVQLIRVPSFRRARVTSTLTAPAWDGSTGGVVAFFVQRTLSLEADINVTGKGFRGATDPEPTDGSCASTNPTAFDSAFYATDGPVIRAGMKGEGITLDNFTLMRGKARNLNGGGGGNARLSGGGGGSNYSAGGKGGSEATDVCDSVVDTRGYGGINLERYFYVNEEDDELFGNRTFFGGGGGRGTNVNDFVSSNGGNGGGLVVIVADSICGNDHSIFADGQSVTGAVSGAGGGGGGGGAILLDVNGFCDNLSLRAIGGNGGNTNHPIDTTGPGGGGGGGIYWLAGSEHSAIALNLNDQGQPGRYTRGISELHYAQVGGKADKINNLRVPLRGFIFNTVPDQYTVCADEIPETIFAGLPKGGDGPASYEYEWLDSTRSHTWQPATYGTHTAQNFAFSSPLSDTTWYRRVVTSGTVLPPDTSFRIAVYVHAAITGNLIAAPDTVCSGNAPLEPFVPSGTIEGGPTGGSYSYQWISQPEGEEYSDATGPGSTDASFQAPELTETTSFARIAYAGVCVDTSAPVLVKVWEQLTNNDITPNDTVCYNTVPDLITGSTPQNGDQSDIRYQWQNSNDSLSGWSLIPGAEGSTYQAPSLIQTTYFRRIVLSGSDDACVDTSNSVEALNIPLITGNTISEDQTVCTNQAPLPLTGSVPGGGVEGVYSYSWESRTLSSDWTTVPGSDGVNTDFEPGTMTGDTTWFRRVIGSGGAERNVCIDNSDSVVINVLPSITGNQLTTADAVKCQLDSAEFIVQDPAAGTEPGGGATQGGNDPTRRYQWESATAASGSDPASWTVIAGETQLNFTARPQLTSDEDYFFRRIVFSGPDEQCSDTATQQIIVHTRITGNSIEPFDSVCFADTKILPGETPAGEPGLSPVYTWRDLDTGTDIPGSDQENLTYGPYNQLGQYHYLRRVAIGECTDTSNAMQITVMQLPGGRLTDDAFHACEQDTSFTIDLNIDQLSTYVMPWEVTLRNQISSGIGPIPVRSDGQLPVTLDIDSDSLELNYEIESIIYRSVEGRYECLSPADSLAGVVPVYVFRKPDPTAMALENPICNTTMTITVDADNGIGTWSSDPAGGVLFTPGVTENTFLASIPNDHEAFGGYRLIFRSEAGDCFDTAVVNARFDEQPDPPIPGPTPAMIFVTDQYEMKADSASAGIGTWEVISGGATVEDANDPHTMVYGLSDEEDNYFRWTVANGACGEADSVMVIYRNEVKRYNGFSPNGDLHNEYFIMQGLPYADEFEIAFFNALGSIVRTITNETVDELEVNESLIAGGLKEDEMVVWDGRSSNGNLVPSGTYYFVLTLRRGTETYPPYKEYVVVETE